MPDSMTPSDSTNSATKLYDFFINGGFILLLTSSVYYYLASNDRFKLSALKVPLDYSKLPFFETVLGTEFLIFIVLPLFIIIFLCLVMILNRILKRYTTADTIFKTSENINYHVNFYLISSSILAIISCVAVYVTYYGLDSNSYWTQSLLFARWIFIYIFLRSLYVFYKNRNIASDATLDKYRYLVKEERNLFNLALILTFVCVAPNVVPASEFTSKSSNDLDVLMYGNESLKCVQDVIYSNSSSTYITANKEVAVEDCKLKIDSDSNNKNVKKELEECDKNLTFENSIQLVDEKNTINKDCEHLIYYVFKVIISKNDDGFVTWRKMYIPEKDIRMGYGRILVFYGDKFYTTEIQKKPIKSISLGWKVKFESGTNTTPISSLFVNFDVDDDQKNLDYLSKQHSLFQIIDHTKISQKYLEYWAK